MGRHRDGHRHRRRHVRPHGGRLDDAARCRPAAGRLRELRDADLRSAGADRGGGIERAAAAHRRAAVRARHRQRHLAAAADRPGRVRQGRRAARGRAHGGDRAGGCTRLRQRCSVSSASSFRFGTAARCSRSRRWCRRYRSARC